MSIYVFSSKEGVTDDKVELRTKLEYVQTIAVNIADPVTTKHIPNITLPPNSRIEVTHKK